MMLLICEAISLFEEDELPVLLVLLLPPLMLLEITVDVVA
jgi:hypothetical protein